MERSRNWCFTLNNYTDDDINSVNTIDCKYLIYGLEVGASGTPHLQGYIMFKSLKSKSQLKKLNGKWHYEAAIGSPTDNVKYCSKENNIFEKGEAPKGQGKRSDIDNIKDLVINKAPMSQIVMEANSLQALRFAQIAKLYLCEDRKEPPTVYWRWGLSGTGKTKWVFDNFESVYIKDGTQWWDGYEQQQCICIDDFDGKWPFRDLLRLLDRYPYQGQVKGGYVKINSPIICITCEWPPSEWWTDNTLLQITRRISEITNVI